MIMKVISNFFCPLFYHNLNILDNIDKRPGSQAHLHFHSKWWSVTLKCIHSIASGICKSFSPWDNAARSSNVCHDLSRSSASSFMLNVHTESLGVRLQATPSYQWTTLALASTIQVSILRCGVYYRSAPLLAHLGSHCEPWGYTTGPV